MEGDEGGGGPGFGGRDGGRVLRSESVGEDEGGTGRDGSRGWGAGRDWRDGRGGSKGHARGGGDRWDASGMSEADAAADDERRELRAGEMMRGVTVGTGGSGGSG